MTSHIQPNKAYEFSLLLHTPTSLNHTSHQASALNAEINYIERSCLSGYKCLILLIHKSCAWQINYTTSYCGLVHLFWKILIQMFDSTLTLFFLLIYGRMRNYWKLLVKNPFWTQIFLTKFKDWMRSFTYLNRNSLELSNEELNLGGVWFILWYGFGMRNETKVV